MSTTRQVIALAAVGNLGKYICEELIADDRFDVVVISRQRQKWLEDREVDVRVSDYSEDSVLSILDSSNATALISLINCPHHLYVDIHRAFLNACMKSKACKRIIPSEWVGNVEDYPLLPSFYANSREPFRKILQESSGVEWTLFNGGWLMDYFLPRGKTYMPPIPDEFPVDPNNWRACIRGTGDEGQAWTCARDIAKALVELLTAAEWEPLTYVAGEWSTFNKAVSVMEKFYGRPFEISYKSADDIQRFITEHAHDEDTPELEIARVEEWMIAGASACPQEKTLRQRAKYFSNVKFLTLAELLRVANEKEFV